MVRRGPETAGRNSRSVLPPSSLTTRGCPVDCEFCAVSTAFGGKYRIVDFVLSNFANSGMLKVKVLVQYKSESLNTHVQRAWRLSAFLNQYVEIVPAQMRYGPKWFEGSADAIYQNLNIITDEEPEYTFVFGADHIYRMDVSQMIAFHEHNEAARVEAVLERLARGESVALVSDAGTPGISDPGALLVEAAHREGLRVVPVPGAKPGSTPSTSKVT